MSFLWLSHWVNAHSQHYGIRLIIKPRQIRAHAPHLLFIHVFILPTLLVWNVTGPHYIHVQRFMWLELVVVLCKVEWFGNWNYKTSCDKFHWGLLNRLSLSLFTLLLPWTTGLKHSWWTFGNESTKVQMCPTRTFWHTHKQQLKERPCMSDGMWYWVLCFKTCLPSSPAKQSAETPNVPILISVRPRRTMQAERWIIRQTECLLNEPWAKHRNEGIF